MNGTATRVLLAAAYEHLGEALANLQRAQAELDERPAVAARLKDRELSAVYGQIILATIQARRAAEALGRRIEGAEEGR